MSKPHDHLQPKRRAFIAQITTVAAKPLRIKVTSRPYREKPFWLTTRDLAERWNCTTEYVRNLITAGELPGTINIAHERGTTRAAYRVPLDAVLAYESRTR
jgi:anaerobic selenocysteine-containing dehydrogenase